MQIPLRTPFHLSWKTAVNLYFMNLELKLAICRQHCVSVIKTSRRTLYTEIIAAFLENYATIITALYGQNCRIFIAKHAEGPATGHLDTVFSWFPSVYKQILRWFPRFQVATTCFSCSPPDLNLLVTDFIFCIHVK